VPIRAQQAIDNKNICLTTIGNSKINCLEIDHVESSPRFPHPEKLTPVAEKLSGFLFIGFDIDP